MGKGIEVYNCFKHEGGELEVTFDDTDHVRVVFYMDGEEFEIEDSYGKHSVEWHYMGKWMFLSGAALTSCEKKVAKEYAISQFKDWVENEDTESCPPWKVRQMVL